MYSNEDNDQSASQSLIPRKATSAYTLAALTRKVDPNDIIKENEEGLKRVLSVWELMAYGIAATVGAGIFVTIGLVGSGIAGPAMVISFLLAGFSSLLSAFCYSEFATRVPVAGSAYTFAYVSLGELMGWFVGWNLTLEYAISASAVARGWAGYFVNLLQSAGVNVPLWLYNYQLSSLFSLSPLALGIIVACTLILLFGVKESARFNMVITVLNLSILAFVIILGAIHVDPANWSPFFPFGIMGTWRGVGTVFFSYIGFDSVSTLAGEVRKPARDLPIGIVGTLLIATVIYIAVSLVITGMVPYAKLDPNAPLSQAFFSMGLGWAGFIVAAGSLTSITATTLVSLIGQPRIFFQMAKDGLLFKLFAKTNSRGVPVWGTVITGVMSGLIAFMLNLDSLANMISIGTLLAFIIVCAGVVILRVEDEGKPFYFKMPLLMLIFIVTSALWALSFTYLQELQPWSFIVTGPLVLLSFVPIALQKQTNFPTTFACPLVPYIPCLGIFMNVWFILSLPPDSLLRLLIWTVIGMAIYFAYGIRNSSLYVNNREENISIK